MIIKRKKRTRRDFIKAKQPIERTGFYPYWLQFEEYLAIKQYSKGTIRRRESCLRRFIMWCDARGVNTPQAVNKALVERYQKHLHYYRQDNGQPLSPGTQSQNLISIKQFFKWLSQANHILFSPAADLELPKAKPRLPNVLTLDDIERLMMQPDCSDPLGLRDRAMLELLYSTGMRRTECIKLTLEDLALSRQVLIVRHGKGDKDRALPIGTKAMDWLKAYLNTVRPQLNINPDNRTVFLNDYGESFSDTKFGDKVKNYLRKADIKASGACHLLRHAMATHMLENGAELRYLQAMLGHTDVKTTQIYAHVSIRKLQEVHAATHPAQRDDREAWLRTLAKDD